MEYTDPSCVKQPYLDTDVAGDWQVTYIATDTNGDSVEKTVTITVETKTIFELGENIIEDGLMKFPDAKIDFNDGETRRLTLI